MRILEDTELGYDIDDIVSSIKDELGFSMVRSDEESGYFALGSGIKLRVEFLSEVHMNLELPEKELDLSDSISQAESYVSALESTIEIINIITRMTKEGGVSIEDLD